MKIVSYLRCSTPGQATEDKFGLDRQRELLDIWLSSHPEAAEIKELRDLGYSGATADRPGLAELLLMKDIDAVLVPCWDRLSRDLTLMGYIRYSLKQSGIKVLSATEESAEDPTSVMIQGILAAVAGFERSLIAGRLAGARRLKASRGGFAHGQPGFSVRSNGNGELELHPQEWAALQQIKIAREAGVSLAGIALDLQTKEVPSKRGGTWTPASVSSALRGYDRAARLAGI